MKSSLKSICKLYLVFSISGFSSVALTESTIEPSIQMISSSVVLAQVTRAETETEIRNFLKNSDVQEQMIKQGVAADEVSNRLASLSEQELFQLSGQVKEARAGGDVLIAVLVIVLIIYLVRRI